MEKEMTQPDWTMIAEIELQYKTKIKPSLRPKISCSADGYKALIANWDPGKIELIEQFKVMLLNRAGRVLGIYEASTGTIGGCIVDSRQIFGVAIKGNASSIILSHNHPSGNLHPSREDQLLTSKIKECGKLLEILVQDHIIVTSESYYSFADNGLL